MIIHQLAKKITKPKNTNKQKKRKNKSKTKSLKTKCTTPPVRRQQAPASQRWPSTHPHRNLVQAQTPAETKLKTAARPAPRNPRFSVGPDTELFRRLQFLPME